MELHGYQDPMRCRAFATTLKGPALAWFNRIPPSSISSFKELSIAFVSHFIGARTYRKPSYHLLIVKQGSQESLKSYVQRFNAESLKIDIPSEKFAITTFIAWLRVQSKDLMFWYYCLNSRVCNYDKRVVIELLRTVIKRFIFIF